jgi:hypothetical protein
LRQTSSKRNAPGGGQSEISRAGRLPPRQQAPSRRAFFEKQALESHFLAYLNIVANSRATTVRLIPFYGALHLCLPRRWGDYVEGTTDLGSGGAILRGSSPLLGRNSYLSGSLRNSDTASSSVLSLGPRPACSRRTRGCVVLLEPGEFGRGPAGLPAQRPWSFLPTPLCGTDRSVALFLGHRQADGNDADGSPHPPSSISSLLHHPSLRTTGVSFSKSCPRQALSLLANLVWMPVDAGRLPGGFAGGCHQLDGHIAQSDPVFS